MSGFPLASFTDTDQGLFSTEEIRGLMRVEHSRAARYSYPVALLMIEIDRLESLHDLYGVDSKREILQGVVGLLRSETRGSDFIGCLDNDRIIALFPHTHSEGASAISRRILMASRRLDFVSDGRSLRASVSIGVSVAEPDREANFDQLIEATGEALRFAVVEGGDRFVQRQPATEYFAELREELEEEARYLKKEHTRNEKTSETPLFDLLPRTAENGEPEAQTESPPPALPEPVEDDVAERIHALFETINRADPDFESVEGQVVAIAQSSVERARESIMVELAGDHARKVDVLERRVSKLRELLDTTETELLRIARAKGVETGVASIYKTVQGLAENEGEFERKKEMLTLLFEANVDLRKEIDDKS